MNRAKLFLKRVSRKKNKYVYALIRDARSLLMKKHSLEYRIHFPIPVSRVTFNSHSSFYTNRVELKLRSAAPFASRMIETCIIYSSIGNSVAKIGQFLFIKLKKTNRNKKYYRSDKMGQISFASVA